MHAGFLPSLRRASSHHAVQTQTSSQCKHQRVLQRQTPRPGSPSLRQPSQNNRLPAATGIAACGTATLGLSAALRFPTAAAERAPRISAAGAAALSLSSSDAPTAATSGSTGTLVCTTAVVCARRSIKQRGRRGGRSRHFPKKLHRHAQSATAGDDQPSQPAPRKQQQSAEPGWAAVTAEPAHSQGGAQAWLPEWRAGYAAMGYRVQPRADTPRLCTTDDWQRREMASLRPTAHAPRQR